MRQLFMILTIILVFSISYAYAQMGGHMTDREMMGESRKEQAAFPGHGGQMMGSGMMGYGGHMMGSGCGEHMMGPDIMGYGAEKEDREFLDDTVGIRREMHNKKFEFSEALRNPDTTRKTLLRLKKEMLEIKIKIYEKAIQIKD